MTEARIEASGPGSGLRLLRLPRLLQRLQDVLAPLADGLHPYCLKLQLRLLQAGQPLPPLPAEPEARWQLQRLRQFAFAGCSRR